MLAELKALTADYQRRLVRCSARVLDERRTRLTSAGRGLPRPADLLALASQRFDHASSRLGAGLERNVAVHKVELVRVAGRLSPHLLDRPRRLRAERLAEVSARMRPAIGRLTDQGIEGVKSLGTRLGAALGRNAAIHSAEFSRVGGRFKPDALNRAIEQRAGRIHEVSPRMEPAFSRIIMRAEERLSNLDKLRVSFNPDGPLNRGFARVHHADGGLARRAGALSAGEAVRLVFADGDRQAVVEGAPPPSPSAVPLPQGGRIQASADRDLPPLGDAPAKRGKGAAKSNPGQGDLF